MTKIDDKIQCPNCKRRIVPRLTFYEGTPYKSWCPICGGLVESFCNFGGIWSSVVFLIVVFAIIFYYAI